MQVKERLVTAFELKSDVSQMPAPWVEQLHYAACSANDEKILELLPDIPEENVAIANTLTDLVMNFQFEKIIELIQQ